MGNRIKPTVIEYPKEQTTLEDYEEDSKVSELESKINEYEELIQAQSHHIEELEQTVKHYQPQVDTFKRMLMHIDSTGYINLGVIKMIGYCLMKLETVKETSQIASLFYCF